MHCLNKANLVMVNDLFDLILNLVCILLRIFESILMNEIGLLIYGVFIWFWYQSNTGFIKKKPVLFYGIIWVNIDLSSSLKFW